MAILHTDPALNPRKYCPYGPQCPLPCGLNHVSVTAGNSRFEKLMMAIGLLVHIDQCVPVSEVPLPEGCVLPRVPSMATLELAPTGPCSVCELPDVVLEGHQSVCAPADCVGLFPVGSLAYGTQLLLVAVLDLPHIRNAPESQKTILTQSYVSNEAIANFVRHDPIVMKMIGICEPHMTDRAIGHRFKANLNSTLARTLLDRYLSHTLTFPVSLESSPVYGDAVYGLMVREAAKADPSLPAERLVSGSGQREVARELGWELPEGHFGTQMFERKVGCDPSFRQSVSNYLLPSTFDLPRAPPGYGRKPVSPEDEGYCWLNAFEPREWYRLSTMFGPGIRWSELRDLAEDRISEYHVVELRGVGHVMPGAGVGIPYNPNMLLGAEEPLEEVTDLGAEGSVSPIDDFVLEVDHRAYDELLYSAPVGPAPPLPEPAVEGRGPMPKKVDLTTNVKGYLSAMSEPEQALRRELQQFEIYKGSVLLRLHALYSLRDSDLNASERAVQARQLSDRTAVEEAIQADPHLQEMLASCPSSFHPELRFERFLWAVGGEFSQRLLQCYFKKTFPKPLPPDSHPDVGSALYQWLAVGSRKFRNKAEAVEVLRPAHMEAVFTELAPELNESIVLQGYAKLASDVQFRRSVAERINGRAFPDTHGFFESTPTPLSPYADGYCWLHWAPVDEWTTLGARLGPHPKWSVVRHLWSNCSVPTQVSRASQFGHVALGVGPSVEYDPDLELGAEPTLQGGATGTASLDFPNRLTRAHRHPVEVLEGSVITFRCVVPFGPPQAIEIEELNCVTNLTNIFPSVRLASVRVTAALTTIGSSLFFGIPNHSFPVDSHMSVLECPNMVSSRVTELGRDGPVSELPLYEGIETQLKLPPAAGILPRIALSFQNAQAGTDWAIVTLEFVVSKFGFQTTHI